MLAESFGRAWESLTQPVGDTDRNPAARLRMERALCRLHGSLRFHDYDYAKDEPFLQFKETDRVGYGIQGGRIVAEQDAKALPFPNQTGAWNPSVEGPPTPEGWGVWDYNAWKAHPISRPSNNDNGIEPSYSTRLTQLTPVRYRTSDTTYERVPFWEHARWISIKNTTGTNPPNVQYKITLTKEDLAGIRVTKPNSDAPNDFAVYSHPYLIQTTSSEAGGNVTWNPLATPIPYDDDVNSLLIPVDYSISRNPDDHTSWDVYLNAAAFHSSWANNAWWHIVIYWGSTDEAAVSIEPAQPGPPVPITVITPTGSELIKWERKNFFRKEITDQVEWTSLAVNDKLDSTHSNIWLIDRKRTHFTFRDGQYSDPLVPDAYALDQDWPAAEVHGLENSIIGYLMDIEEGNAVPVLFTSKNRGTAYDFPSSEMKLVVGPSLPPEHWPTNWEDCTYFPDAPTDHEVIAKVVYARAPGPIYGLVEGADGGTVGAVKVFGTETGGIPSNLHDNFSIIYIEQTAVTFAHPPFDDEELALSVLPSLHEAVLRYRNFNPALPILEAAYQVLAPALRMPASLAPNRVSLVNPDGTASKSFRGLLKRPTATALKADVDEKPAAFQLSAGARGVIEDLSSLPPSTEAMRLESDKLTLNDTRFRKATNFELFHEPSDQCSSVDPEAAGVKIGWDYRFRWLFEDANENTFFKELDVMASKYFLTDQEYENRVAQGLNTTGYFKRGTDEERQNRAKGTLETIPEWRLHGYAGLIPDLFQGESRLIRTKVVSPPDDTRITEEQFRKNLENQGYTEEEIDEKVQEYLDAGGEFYVIDLRQHEDDWVAVRSASVSVALYTYATVPYWKDNIWGRFGLAQTQHGEQSNPAFNTLRSDGFTIAPSNLTVGTLETFGNQSLLPGDAALDQSNLSNFSGIEKVFIGDALAFQLETTDKSGISEFAMRLKVIPADGNATGKLTNANADYLRVLLYSNVTDSNGVHLPGEVIVTGGSVLYSTLTDTFAEVRFSLFATLASGARYWVVVEKSAATEGGEIVVDSKGSVLDKMAFLYDTFYVTPSAGTWRDNIGEAWLKCFDIIDPTSATTPILDQSSNDGIEDIFIAQAMGIYLPVSASATKSFKVKMKFVPASTNATGLPLNGPGDVITAQVFSDAGLGVPQTIQGVTGSEFQIMDLTNEWQEVLFTIDVDSLANANYWLVLRKSAQTIGGHIVVEKAATPDDIAKREIDQTWTIDAGDAWFKFYQTNPKVLGAFNRNTINIQEHLPGPNDRRTIGTNKVEGHWAYTCDKLDTPGPISIYPRAAQNDSSVWEYVKRSKDIHVCVRYEKGGEVYDFTTVLSGARGWRVLWWKKTSGSYKVIDQNVAPDLDTVATELNYTGFSVDGQSTYINARFEGVFRPTENGIYNIRVLANDGVRLYLDDVLLIDQMPVQDPTSTQTYTVATPTLSNTQDYTFVVEHYYGTPHDGSDTQRLNVQWAPPSTPSTYSNINDNSEPAPAPVQIDSDNVDRVVFVAVAKTAEELETATHGAPPGDILILRSN